MIWARRKKERKCNGHLKVGSGGVTCGLEGGWERMERESCVEEGPFEDPHVVCGGATSEK